MYFGLVNESGPSFVKAFATYFCPKRVTLIFYAYDLRS